MSNKVHLQQCQDCSNKFSTKSYKAKRCKKCFRLKAVQRTRNFHFRKKTGGKIGFNVGIKRKTVNEDFFSKWSPKMSWVLGFFYADGCLYKANNKFRIEFSNKDKDVLEQINYLIKSTYRIGKRANKKKNTWYQLTIPNTKISTDLMNLGAIPRKSLKLVLPKVPKEHVSHFIRGYFDGDGCIHCTPSVVNSILSLSFCSGSQRALKQIKFWLKDIAPSKQKINYSSKVWNLAYSTAQSIRIGHFLYSNSTSETRLKRKYDIYQKFLLNYRRKLERWQLSTLLSDLKEK